MEYDYETIEARMKSLPKELQRAMVSVDTARIVLEIAEENGLLLDKIEALEEVTSHALLGFIPSRNFTSELSKKADISMTEASKVATEVNTRIFSKVREALQKVQSQDQTPSQTPPPFKATVIPTPPPTPIIKPTLEQAGRFTIEKPPVGFSTQYEKVPIKKEAILDIIEDLKEIKDIQNKDTSMIDHLLNQPVSAPEKKEFQIPQQKTPPPPPREPYTSDPYREQI